MWVKSEDHMTGGVKLMFGCLMLVACSLTPFAQQDFGVVPQILSESRIREDHPHDSLCKIFAFALSSQYHLLGAG